MDHWDRDSSEYTFYPKIVQFPYPTLLNSSALPIVTISHQILLILI